MIINAFKDKIFPLYSGDYFQQQEDETSEADSDDELILSFIELYN